jgi:anti-anti-sigma factor
MSLGVFREGPPGADVVFSAPRRGRPTAIASPDQLAVQRQDGVEGTVVLAYKGRLDINTVLTFRDVTFAVIGDRPKRLILDLSQISLVENAGIAALVTICRVINLVGMDYEVVPSPCLAETFSVTGLDKLVQQPLTGAAIAAEVFSRLD